MQKRRLSARTEEGIGSLSTETKVRARVSRHQLLDGEAIRANCSIRPWREDDVKMMNLLRTYHESRLPSWACVDPTHEDGNKNRGQIRNWGQPRYRFLPFHHHNIPALHASDSCHQLGKSCSRIMAPTSEVNPAVKAARDILIAQSRPQRSTKEKPLSVRAAAAKYKTSKTAVARHLKSMKLLGKADYSDKGRGRPKNLDGSEARAVIAYINWLERAGIPASHEFVEEAANKLRASRTPPAPPVGESWYTRFLADHPELLERRRNIGVSGRESPGFERLEEFYTNLARLVKNCDLTASQIFNADECGLRFGPVRERFEMAIVKKKRDKRESSTIVLFANAAGSKDCTLLLSLLF